MATTNNKKQKKNKQKQTKLTTDVFNIKNLLETKFHFSTDQVNHLQLGYLKQTISRTVNVTQA